MQVTIIPNPAFAPTPDQREAFAQVKKHGQIDGVPMTTAMENIRLSGGMYAIKSSAPDAAPSMDLDGMKAEELKVMMVKMNIAPPKKMTKAEAVAMIRAKLDETEMPED
jgi:hypothetical protein